MFIRSRGEIRDGSQFRVILLRLEADLWRKAIMAIDPVCKMQVEESKAAATTTYAGKTYYFCAVSCKNKFEQNPQQYVSKSG